MGLWGSTMGAFGVGGSGGGTGGTAFSQFGQPPPPTLALPPAIRMAPGGGMEQAGATGGWQTLGQMNPGVSEMRQGTQADLLRGIYGPGDPNKGGMGGTTRRGSQILDAQGNMIGHYDDNNQPVYHGGLGPSTATSSRGTFTSPQGDPNTPRIGIMPYGGAPTGGPIASTSMGMAPSYARLGVPGSMQTPGRDYLNEPGGPYRENGIYYNADGSPMKNAPNGGLNTPPTQGQQDQFNARYPPGRQYLNEPGGPYLENGVYYNANGTPMQNAPNGGPNRPLGVPGSMQQSLYGNGLLRPAMPSMNNQSGY